MAKDFQWDDGTQNFEKWRMKLLYTSEGALDNAADISIIIPVMS